MKKILIIFMILIFITIMSFGIYLSIQMSFNDKYIENEKTSTTEDNIETTTSVNNQNIETTENDSAVVTTTSEDKEYYEEDDSLSDSIKSNSDAQLLTPTEEELLKERMWAYFSVGKLEEGVNMFYEELKKHSIDESSEDLLKFYQEASMLIHVPNIETEYALDIFNAVTDDALLINSVIRSRTDTQIEAVLDKESLIIFTDEEITFIGESEILDEEFNYLNQKYPGATFSKYTFEIAGEEINGFVFYNIRNERRIAGFYWNYDEVENKDLYFSTKSSWID